MKLVEETPVEGELITATHTAIAQLDPFEAELAEFRKRYDGVVYDLTVEEDNKQARSDRFAIGKVVARLDAQHKAIKEPLLEVTRQLDGRRKEIKDGLLDVQNGIKTQIQAHEAKEEARVEAHYQRIQDISQLYSPSAIFLKAENVQALLDDARRIVVDTSFEEFEADAALAKSKTIKLLEEQLATRQKYEAEQAELAKLRAEKEARDRADREAEVAAEAAKRAKREAEEAHQAHIERIERARLEAEEQAKREVAEANARTKRAADEERARIEAEQKAKAEKEAADAKAEEVRKNKVKHRQKIEKETMIGIVDATGLLEDDALAIIAAVNEGRIPNLHIVY